LSYEPALPIAPLPEPTIAPLPWPVLDPMPVESAVSGLPTTREGVAAGLSRLVDDLLNPASERNLAERVGELVAGLLVLVDDLLGNGKTPGPADAPAAALQGLAAEMLRLMDGLLDSGSGQDLAERVGGLVAGLMGLVDGLLDGGATQGPVPPLPAPDAPAAPVPAPSSPTSFSSGGSTAFGDGTASVLLLAVLALSSALLGGSGSSSWHSRAFPRPGSVLQPAIERPG
jgi:hypothetical protein